MPLEHFKTKEELRALIDAYASLGDEKRIPEQMRLFTKNAVYKVFINGMAVTDIQGTETLEKEFSAHASAVLTYFTLNGQHQVSIENDEATGVSYTQIKMIRAAENGNVITDYSVRYEDVYTQSEGKWLIKERIAHFLIIDARPLLS